MFAVIQCDLEVRARSRHANMFSMYVQSTGPPADNEINMFVVIESREATVADARTVSATAAR